MLYELFDHLEGNRSYIGARERAIYDVHWMPDRSCENLGVEIVIILDLDDVGYQLHTVR
jgi:hypothetical protein